MTAPSRPSTSPRSGWTARRRPRAPRHGPVPRQAPARDRRRHDRGCVRSRPHDHRRHLRRDPRTSRVRRDRRPCSRWDRVGAAGRSGRHGRPERGRRDGRLADRRRSAGLRVADLARCPGRVRPVRKPGQRRHPNVGRGRDRRRPPARRPDRRPAAGRGRDRRTGVSFIDITSARTTSTVPLDGGAHGHGVRRRDRGHRALRDEWLRRGTELSRPQGQR